MKISTTTFNPTQNPGRSWTIEQHAELTNISRVTTNGDNVVVHGMLQKTVIKRGRTSSMTQQACIITMSKTELGDMLRQSVEGEPDMDLVSHREELWVENKKNQTGLNFPPRHT